MADMVTGMHGRSGERWELRLFVAGSAASGERSFENLTRICEQFLPGRFDIKVVDIDLSPEEADAFDIVAAPTVVRQKPEPVRRIIGDLSLIDEVVAGLGLPRLR